MAREAHSASSIELGARCQHAWALRYIAGIKEPDYAWNDPKAPPRARAAALGKEVHKRLERYLLGKHVEWHDRPGQIAASGVRYLPAPRDVARTEFTFTVEVDGVTWRGVIDAETKTGTLIDHKTTRTIALYAHTPESLATNFQACVYEAARGPSLMRVRRMVRNQATHRWVYYQTDPTAPPASRKVEATITTTAALAAFASESTLARRDVLARRDALRGTSFAPTTLAKQLDTLKEVDDAPRNRLACWDYGGCLYHVSYGGPCTERRSVGALVALSRKKESKTMAEDKFAAAKKRALEGADAVETADESAPPAAPAAKRGRPPGKPKVDAPPEGIGARAAKLAALATPLARAQVAYDAAKAKADAAAVELGAVLDQYREALES